MLTTGTKARYDGIADWYDTVSSAAYATEVASLLGPGTGRCLDLGCGTGHYLDALRSTGREVIGVDVSADQLRVARSRGNQLAQADATALPFADGVFSTVSAIWVSTDVDDFVGAMRESFRVLAPGGQLLVFGVHPCFNGPCVEKGAGDTQIVHPTYRQALRHSDSPWWGRDGIRHRVGGMRHLPLAELVNSIVSCGLRIDRMAEPGDAAIPVILAILATRP